MNTATNIPMQNIPATEIQVHPASVVDSSGVLFAWEDKLYRALRHNAAESMDRLFESGLIKQLVEKGLIVATEPTDFMLAGFAAVVQHRKIETVSYCYEWSPKMLRQAAMLVLELNIELAKYGYATQDAHPWNVLFEKGKPIFVDLGSIVESPADTPWRAQEEFNRYYLRPLMLYAKGRARLARWLLHDLRNGVLASDLSGALPQHGGGPQFSAALHQIIDPPINRAFRILNSRLSSRTKTYVRGLGNRLRRRAGSDAFSRTRWLRGMMDNVDRIRFKDSKTAWSEYEKHDLSLTPDETWTAKQTNVHAILGRLKPTTMLDIGCNKGWWSKLATQFGANVIAVDTDHVSVDRLFQEAQTTGAAILPLLMDVTNPTPGYGYHNHQLLPATDRLRCEMVLALAVTHHLVFGQGMSFELIAETMNAFSEKWLIIEFIPGDDRFVSEWLSNDPTKATWYNLDNFLNALKQYFEITDLVDSHPAPRKLILCQKWAA